MQPTNSDTPTTPPTPEQVSALAEAMEQLLDDMGPDRHWVSKFAKAKARLAYEPWLTDPEMVEYYMPLDDAKAVLRECGFLT